MAADPSISRLTQLAVSILESVTKLEEVLSAEGIASPSFHENAPPLKFPKDALGVRDSIVDSAAEVQDLLQSPLDLIYRHASVMTFRTLYILPVYWIW